MEAKLLARFNAGEIDAGGYIRLSRALAEEE
jgi:hypothetical protein